VTEAKVIHELCTHFERKPSYIFEWEKAEPHMMLASGDFWIHNTLS
jgi:hypothetical protein